MYRALAEGYTNADALINFHYRAIEDDRRLAQEAPGTRGSSTIGWAMKQMTPGQANAWADDRVRMIDNLQRDAEYRAYIDGLKPDQLFDYTMPQRVRDELNRLEFERRRSNAGQDPYWWIRRRSGQ